MRLLIMRFLNEESLPDSNQEGRLHLRGREGSGISSSVALRLIFNQNRSNCDSDPNFCKV